ncbi:MAG TPA: amidohydrolase family protein [Acidimicrobiales bacterium]|nr:amidohydrolase family protein [Acidimicrobiales bacterium]
MVDIEETLMSMSVPEGGLTLRADPVPALVVHPVISVDDHAIEPPDTFTGRLPRKFAETGPRIEREDAVDYWVFEGVRVPLLGVEGIQSWEPGKGHFGPITFDKFRPGMWQIDHRVKDMKAAGIIGSLNFPSAIFGFAGQRFMRMKDRELGLASMRAYNDWIIESWTAPHPDRIIPCQITWLSDPEVAAAEIRRNAERGFKAVAFTENPEKLGLPSIYKEHWDPFLRACEETETVINLHVGSSSETMLPSSDSDLAVLGVLFPVNGFAAAADWLFAKVPLRFPGVKIVLSEGGIGWVPILLDRLSYMGRDDDRRAAFGGMTPIEVFRRNFWFTTFSDERTLALRAEIGVDRIMFETDFPHTDSSWPDTQEIVAAQLTGVPKSEADRMTFANAAELYRHPLPAGRFASQ